MAGDADLAAQIQRNDPTAFTGSWSRRRLAQLLDVARLVLGAAYRVARMGLVRETPALGTSAIGAYTMSRHDDRQSAGYDER